MGNELRLTGQFRITPKDSSRGLGELFEFSFVLYPSTSTSLLCLGAAERNSKLAY